MNRRTSAWAAAHAPAGRRGKKVLSMLLSLVLCLTLLPAGAWAADSYGFSINGTAVNFDNIQNYDVLGVTATKKDMTYSISYDTTTHTLTLENVTITGDSMYAKGQKVLNCSNEVNTIKLVGENVISSAAFENAPANISCIFAESSLTIEGKSTEDKLTITMPEVKVSSTYSGTNVRGINVASEEKSLLTIQNCTLDVVCAGETTSAWSVMNALYTKNGDISIASANVKAVIGKARGSDDSLNIRGGTAIYAVGGTLSITNSTVTAGAYSSKNLKESGSSNKYTALEGKTIELTGCTLNLTGEATALDTAIARAIHTNMSDGSITLTNCTGTLSGSDYGIHIELNDKTKTNNATLAISGGNPTITGGKNAIYTTGKTPAFTCVTVKSGEDEDSAQEIHLDTPPEKFWEAKYLNTTRPITSVEINDTNFPDFNFRAVVSTFDTDQNGSLSAEELGAVEKIECGRKDIADLTGIAYFTALEELNCTGNRLTELDVSSNTALKMLYCGKNQLTSLNVSGNAALEKLLCFKNRLTALDVSKNTALTYLDCSNNQLTSLDISQNTQLNTLYADNNAYEIEPDNEGKFDLSTLSGFDVSKASDWTGGFVDNNGILTVENDAALVTYTYSLVCEVDGESTVAFALMVKGAGTDIAIDENHFPDAAFRSYLNDPDSNIDWNRDGKLSAGEVALVKEIDVYDESDIKSLEGIEYFTALTYLDCHGCNLTSLDLSKNTKLTDLFADDNTYEIEPDANGKFDLSTLPGSFDVKKASSWQGGTVSGSILTPTAEQITYTYDCGNNYSVTFTLESVKQYSVTAYGLYGSRPGFTPGTTHIRSYAAGDTVNLPIGTRKDYTFSGLTCEEIEEKYLTIGSDMGEPIVSFTMPATNVTITVNWAKNSSSGGSGSSGSTTYPVTVTGKTENGSVTVSPKNASKGTTVTVTVTPDKGYTLETLTVTDASGKELTLTDKGDGRFTFTMPAGKVEIKASFMEDNTMLNYFVDVKVGDYFYDAVLWAAKNGITNGINDTEFGPSQSCTRAQIVTFLWRAAGSPVVNYAMSMDDVNEGSYYAEAVRWALSEGITGGVGDGRFDPNAACTREQAVAFLYRAAGSPAVSGGSAFSDVAANAYYADAVAWAEKHGVTGGIGGGLFGSGNDCTRGQIVTLLYRAYSE